MLAARLDHALDLYDDGVAPMIVVTGGRQPGDRFTEATAAATYLHEHGVPDDAILRETSGRSSWESLAAAGQFLKDTGHDPRRARVRSVSRGPHRRHRRRGRPRRGDVTDADEPDLGWAEWRRFGTETLRVAAGRVFGYRRLERGKEMGRVVPGLGMLIPPSGVV